MKLAHFGQLLLILLTEHVIVIFSTQRKFDEVSLGGFTLSSTGSIKEWNIFFLIHFGLFFFSVVYLSLALNSLEKIFG